MKLGAGLLAYTPGKVFMAGPFEGAPFSIAAITSAKVGPFDLGTVVVHLLLFRHDREEGNRQDPRPQEDHLSQGQADSARDAADADRIRRSERRRNSPEHPDHGHRLPEGGGWAEEGEERAKERVAGVDSRGGGLYLLRGGRGRWR
jgi:hypothetical protein